MKKLSIIIPVYNTSKYLERCIKSTIEQDFKEIEVIIINDCSTDNSLEIIHKYLKIDQRLILINKEKNEGLSAARNSGIEIATGEYILHIDSDDWVEKDYFKEMYEYAQKNCADIVISDYYIDFDNGQNFYTRDQDNIVEVVKEKGIENIFLLKSYPCVWNKLIKTELYKKNKVQHPKGISLGEDLAVIPKLMYFSKKIIKLNKAYYHYIQNPLSITSQNNINKFYDLYKVIKLNVEFFNKINIRLSIKEFAINYLSLRIFDNYRENFKNIKYKEIVSEYLKLFDNIEKDKIFSKKVKLFSYMLKYFNSKLIFIIFCKMNYIYLKFIRNVKKEKLKNAK